ncbi:MAG: hypothetical protein WC538_22775 [Thermoanaerobaculia bacterium]|jgi:hypothetical protein
MIRERAATLLLIGTGLILGGMAHAAPLSGWGRVSLFATGETTKFDDGTKRDYSELTSTIRFASGEADTDGLEFALDVRSSTFPSTQNADPRTTIYDAWIGRRIASGTLDARAGQMWLTDFGSIGSVAGAMLEYRSPAASSLGRFRTGVFGGLEPEGYDVGYVPGVEKYGAWLALDGDAARRNVLGYVLIKDYGLTERSVLTMTNFIPVGGSFSLYQAAEYDLSGPGGASEGDGLNYFFANARYLPSRRVEVMGTYHHGTAIDSRSITQDILNGRPLDQHALDGFLFESMGGRVTVEVIPNVRVYGGYARDRNNSSDEPSGRTTLGLWATDIARSGFDLTLSDNRIDQPEGGYDAWYASLGRTFGSRFYVAAEYSTSLSVVRITDSGGTVVENRPRALRYGLNGSWNINRRYSLLFAAEELQEDASTDDRLMLGLTIRF